MTIATGFLAKSAQVAGVTLSGTTTFGLSQGGVPVDLRSDGELYARVTPIIPTNIELDVETKDIASTVDAGTTGALSLAVFAALLAAYLSGESMVWMRQLNARRARALRPRLDAGDGRAVHELQIG